MRTGIKVLGMVMVAAILSGCANFAVGPLTATDAYFTSKRVNVRAKNRLMRQVLTSKLPEEKKQTALRIISMGARGEEVSLAISVDLLALGERTLNTNAEPLTLGEKIRRGVLTIGDIGILAVGAKALDRDSSGSTIPMAERMLYLQTTGDGNTYYINTGAGIAAGAITPPAE